MVAGAVAILAFAGLLVSVWRSPDQDLRCDKAKRLERAEQGRKYSCLIQIPGHDRGH
jgi:hypothetical protein